MAYLKLVMAIPSLKCRLRDVLFSHSKLVISGLDLSSNKYWILEVDQTNRRSSEVDNDSLLLVYLTHGSRCTSELNRPSFWTNKDRAPPSEELGLMNPCLKSSCNCSDNSYIFGWAQLILVIELTERLWKLRRLKFHWSELEEGPASPRETLLEIRTIGPDAPHSQQPFPLGVGPLHLLSVSKVYGCQYFAIASIVPFLVTCMHLWVQGPLFCDILLLKGCCWVTGCFCESSASFCGQIASAYLGNELGTDQGLTLGNVQCMLNIVSLTFSTTTDIENDSIFSIHRVKDHRCSSLEVQRLTLHEVSVKTRAHSLHVPSVIPASSSPQLLSTVLTTQRMCYSPRLLSLDDSEEVSTNGPGATITVVVSGVPGDWIYVHNNDHDGSEAPDESPVVNFSDLISGAYSGQIQLLAGRLLRLGNIIPTVNRLVVVLGSSPWSESLSTSALVEGLWKVWGRTVILAPISVMSVEGGRLYSSVPSGGRQAHSRLTLILILMEWKYLVDPLGMDESVMVGYCADSREVRSIQSTDDRGMPPSDISAHSWLPESPAGLRVGRRRMCRTWYKIKPPQYMDFMMDIESGDIGLIFEDLWDLGGFVDTSRGQELCFFVETKTKCVCCVSETKDLILAIEPACASLDHHHHPSLYSKIVKSPSWQFVLVKGVSGGGEGFIPIGDVGVQGVGDDRGKFGGLPTLAPRSYKDYCNVGPCGDIRWVEAKMVSPEVESEKWRRLLLHWIYVAFNVPTDGRKEDFFPRNGM
ncbi:hypothetical protein Tco_0970753 [Tanacetum coccineum]